MESVQLELNLNNLSHNDLVLDQMQKQIDAACDSMGKVRRKLFSEMGEMKKNFQLLQEENRELKEMLRKLNQEKHHFNTQDRYDLFYMPESSNSISMRTAILGNFS